MIPMIEIKIKEKQKEIDNVLAIWSADVKKIGETKNFDEYSKKAEKLYNRIAKKYASTLYELNSELEQLEYQLEKLTLK